MISVMTLYNTILKKSFNENVPLTLMKLQRLLYLVYLEYAKQTGEALFSENFEVWPSGPVLRSVYDKFACMQEKIACFGHDAQGNVSVLSDGQCTLNQIIDSVWNYYRFFSGIQLARLSMKPDGPWYPAFQNKESIITFQDVERTLLCQDGHS